MKILPLSALSAPIEILNNVLFPAPLGPSKPTISPGKTLSDNFFKIGLPSKVLLTSFTSKIGLSFLNFNNDEQGNDSLLLGEAAEFKILLESTNDKTNILVESLDGEQEAAEDLLSKINELLS